MKNATTAMPRITMSIALLALCAGLMCLAPRPSASAAELDAKPHLIIELNNLDQRPGACRLSLLIENHLGRMIPELSFELVLFDQQQHIIQLLAVAAGAFPKSKSRVKQFDLKSIECARIARVLMNNITQCNATGFTPETCLAATRTRSRTTIPLAY